MLTYDVLIIGSGLSGLVLALSLADSNRVALVSKEHLISGSSQFAQGGIAAVMSETDSIASHIQDTLKVGVGLCHKDVVVHVVKQAQSAVDWLLVHGVRFTAEAQTHPAYHLMKEGGHSHRRVLHIKDQTGHAIVKTLTEQVLAHPKIDCFTECVAVQLAITVDGCQGAYFYHEGEQRLFTMGAHHTVLATGGASHLYWHVSHVNHTSGDGIAMAWRAGCRVANLEFNQFHPTCLYQPGSPPFLISEVARGEGARLLLPNGQAFMDAYDKRAEMAPRDIVARAIDAELKKYNLDCVYLDMRVVGHAAQIRKIFPTIYAHCLQAGLDITKEPIPVVPAAHYTCGGVMTDLRGKTDVSRLYAIGEVAFTGFHGANRMASNSLLECLVFAVNAAQSIMAAPKHTIVPFSFKKTQWKQGHGSSKQSFVSELMHELRKMMWDKVGIIRNNAGLVFAYQQCQLVKQKMDVQFSDSVLDKNLIELYHAVTVASLMIKSAMLRKESRGLHYNEDYLTTQLLPRDTILLSVYGVQSQV